MASSMLSGSQRAVLATAMAVSGTVILLAFGLQKSTQVAMINVPIPGHSSSQPILRSCISSGGSIDGKKREKKKKRVQFAEDVAEPSGNSEEFRRQHRHSSNYANSSASNRLMKDESGGGRLPANRVALYNGILRDRRVVHRFSYSSY